LPFGQVISRINRISLLHCLLANVSTPRSRGWDTVAAVDRQRPPWFIEFSLVYHNVRMMRILCPLCVTSFDRKNLSHFFPEECQQNNIRVRLRLEENPSTAEGGEEKPADADAEDELHCERAGRNTKHQHIGSGRSNFPSNFRITEAIESSGSVAPHFDQKRLRYSSRGNSHHALDDSIG